MTKDDLISRQAAIDILMKEWKAYKDYPYVSHVRHGLEIAIAILENKVPSAQRTGRWLKNDNGTYSCDQCHSWIPNEQHYYARYCIFCGARMEEEEDGNQS